jgi:hypothetical protein
MLGSEKLKRDAPVMLYPQVNSNSPRARPSVSKLELDSMKC